MWEREKKKSDVYKRKSSDYYSNLSILVYIKSLERWQWQIWRCSCNNAHISYTRTPVMGFSSPSQNLAMASSSQIGLQPARHFDEMGDLPHNLQWPPYLREDCNVVANSPLEAMPPSCNAPLHPSCMRPMIIIQGQIFFPWSIRFKYPFLVPSPGLRSSVPFQSLFSEE